MRILTSSVFWSFQSFVKFTVQPKRLWPSI